VNFQKRVHFLNAEAIMLETFMFSICSLAV